MGAQGLQELPYLKWLNVGHNYIEDVVALSGSFRLRELRLGNNNIADLEGLEGLHDLEYLGLEHNQAWFPDWWCPFQQACREGQRGL